jgi:hypothetical protein
MIYIRGQSYDNESNMKGKERMMQKRLLDINSKHFTLLMIVIVLIADVCVYIYNCDFL